MRTSVPKATFQTIFCASSSNIDEAVPIDLAHQLGMFSEGDANRSRLDATPGWRQSFEKQESNPNSEKESHMVV